MHARIRVNPCTQKGPQVALLTSNTVVGDKKNSILMETKITVFEILI